MPSEKQVKWSQLRVGLTVIFASVALAVLIFLMTSTTGLFTRKLVVDAYVDNAGGLTVGAPVRLEGVDIGNVVGIRVTADPKRKLAPVRVSMKVTTKYEETMKNDCEVSLATAGVLGQVFVDMDCRQAKGSPLKNGDELPTRDTPQLQDVVRASQGTLENLNVLIKRLSDTVSYIQSGQGSIGKLIYDQALYNQATATLTELQQIVSQVNSKEGSIGKLLNSDELYNKANAAIDSVNKIVSDVDNGQGTIGKFLKDPTLYNNANQTMAKANELVTGINAGKGTLGRLAKDDELGRKLDETITRLNNIADRLDKGEGTAGKFLKDPSLYNNADATLVETRNLIAAIRKDPKTYLTIRLKIF